MILKGRGVKHTKCQPIWLDTVNNVQLKSTIRYFIASYHFQPLSLHFFLAALNQYNQGVWTFPWH